MSDWQGDDRRGSNVSLSDILVEVREVKSDVKNLVNSFSLHVNDDKENFKAIKSDVVFLQRVAFIAFGAWALFQFLVSSGTVSLDHNAPDSNNNSYYYRNNDNTNVGGHKDSPRESWMAGGSTAK